MGKLLAVRRGLAAAALAGAAVVAGPAVTASAAPASAASTGKFRLCSNGFYDSYAVFPGRGGFTTLPVLFGTCAVSSVPGIANEQVDLYEADRTYIGSTIYNGSIGETVTTIPGPSFYVSVE
jgi:hypothetical protein